MRKNVGTAEQLIKMIEINGGISSDEYTPNHQAEVRRKVKHVKLLMWLYKCLGFENWYEITTENINEWVDKLSSLTPANF